MFQNGKTHAKTAYMTEVDPDEVPVAVDLSCDRSIQAPWCIDLHNNATTTIKNAFKSSGGPRPSRGIYHIENR